MWLGRSKLGLIYQEVCCSNISSGIFKIMKIDPRKKWRKADSVSLDRSSTDTAIENYDFRIFRSEIRPILYYLIRVSFLTTLVIYKAYFKSRHIWIQRLKTHILCVKLLHLCTIGFVTKCFLIFIIYEVKNFASQPIIQVIGVSHVLRSV